MCRATPRPFAFRNPAVTDQTMLHVRFDPAGNVAAVKQTGKEADRLDQSDERPDADAGPQAQLLRRAVRQYRHDQSARAPGAASAVRRSFLPPPRFGLSAAHDRDARRHDLCRLSEARQLLSAQQPLSDLHDEMLFIVIHQTKELWMKQMLHELIWRSSWSARTFAPAYKAMARVGRIQAVMTLSWDVLSTLTPVDYSAFRHVLGTSSGFQSAQFRELEYRLGLKDPQLPRIS